MGENLEQARNKKVADPQKPHQNREKPKRHKTDNRTNTSLREGSKGR
jgi:hypothetical protein